MREARKKTNQVFFAPGLIFLPVQKFPPLVLCFSFLTNGLTFLPSEIRGKRESLFSTERKKGREEAAAKKEEEFVAAAQSVDISSHFDFPEKHFFLPSYELLSLSPLFSRFLPHHFHSPASVTRSRRVRASVPSLALIMANKMVAARFSAA